MGVELITERYKDQIAGVLSCYDRIIIQGTVPGWCYAGGMTDYFYKHQLRIFDYPKWAEPLRETLRANMEGVAAENGIEIEFVRSKKSFQVTSAAQSGSCNTTDLHMPALDGFEVLEKLRCDQRFAATPIVAPTASAMQRTIRGVYQLHCHTKSEVATKRDGPVVEIMLDVVRWRIRRFTARRDDNAPGHGLKGVGAARA
jgi:CheY-like chemotaxis protein